VKDADDQTQEAEVVKAHPDLFQPAQEAAA
jgi:hypothetical protein